MPAEGDVRVPWDVTDEDEPSADQPPRYDDVEDQLPIEERGHAPRSDSAGP